MLRLQSWALTVYTSPESCKI